MSPRLKNRLTLLAIVGPFIVFFIVGRYFVDPWSLPRENKGQLIIPHVQIAALELQDADGEPYDDADTQGLWSLLYVAGPDCDRACKNGLYYQMRQVQRTLGENMERLRRVVVLTAPASEDLRGFLDDQAAGMVETRGDAGTVKAALAPAYEDAGGDAVGDIFVVSPDGQIFLRYPTHEDMDATLEEAENIRLDLERTLKGSLI
ncbi:SCO family protein [Alcanivorax marinus]|uniref:SCO family protein n=1 Tax=Alloalcanivorax marinus TaxID=1177169 RepID=A0A9Q3UHX3_9GAMM|nr:SCO family protein [Alloalcanivorax marinus]MCC4307302.1 SCO family protein [Alloalcanivorax marinus]MCH2558199.1 SCO family protein [Alcanivorax sp.]